MLKDWKGKSWTVWVAWLVVLAMVLTLGSSVFYALAG